MVDIKTQIQRLQIIEKEIIKLNFDKYIKYGIINSIRKVEDDLYEKV